MVEERKVLIMPRTVPVIVTGPDGIEHRFTSCASAGRYIGISGGNVSQQCVMGYPIHGYRVRYERKNKMGQLMEGSVDNV